MRCEHVRSSKARHVVRERKLDITAGQQSLTLLCRSLLALLHA